MLSCLQALCLLPHPLLFIFYFLPSLGGCANEYFMAGNQREFPRQLPALPRQVQPKSRCLRKDASARKPSREERARVGKQAASLVWAGVSCPPPRRCCHCLFSLRGTAGDRGGRTSVVAAWPLRFPCILSHACRATLRHNNTCPLLSPVCHQLPQPSERAVSPAHLPPLRRSAALYRGSSQRRAAAPRPHGARGTERGAGSVGSPCPHP